MKTIKPIDMGGVLGGSKFIVQGILFKHAVSEGCMWREEWKEEEGGGRRGREKGGGGRGRGRMIEEKGEY
jgi:hypothetical protein